MDKTDYRIIKLKTGESIIAGILPLTKKETITLDNPMAFKTISVMDDKHNGMKEFLVIRNWIEYASEKSIEIPSDSIIAIVRPDEKLTSVYEFEKNKESYTIEELEQALKEAQELGLKEGNGVTKNNNLSTVNVELQLTPEASMEFLEMMGFELSEPDQDDRESIDDQDESIEEFLGDDEFTEAPSPKSKKLMKSKEELPKFGNDFLDWSPDPNDYIR